MKKLIMILFIGFCIVFTESCLQEYLDKAPQAGLTEQDVFSKYENTKSFFDSMYKGQNNTIKIWHYIWFQFWGHKYGWDALTDMSDQGRMGNSLQIIKAGNLASTLFRFEALADGRDLLHSPFINIRKCNLVLANIDKIKDASQEDIDDLKAQAYFIRAYGHMTFVRLFGGTPYITKVVGPDDQWDLPRLSRHESLMRVVADFDTAVLYFEKANRMRRDNPAVGGAGHLNHPDQFRPNGVTAKAFKARALLWAASPLNNELGTKDWEEAAKANWEALKLAETWGYFLLNDANYSYNFINTNYSDEQIWAYACGSKTYNTGDLCALLNGIFASSKGTNSGENPTQNTVDKFESQWGDPLKTDADRQAAIAAGHYNDQNPYANRDPRFYLDIIYNTKPIPGYTTANIYYTIVGGAATYSELLDHTYDGYSKTGYYQSKFWGGQSVKNQTSPLMTDPIIRLAELYLNYAEAANEAYGPNTPAPGASMTAVQAINVIRNRIKMPNVLPQFTVSTDAFRPRIKNERTVELCFEGHYFYDIRRWMDAPVTMGSPLYGIDVEKVTTSSTYPTGFRYTRVLLPSERQSVWKEAMYFWPFPAADNYKMKNFTPNALW